MKEVELKQTLELSGIYKRIWELAQPYLDTRKNDTHTAIATAFAFRLLEMEGGDEDIVIPAILLHDVGWKKVPEDVQLKAFGPHATRPEWTGRFDCHGFDTPQPGKISQQRPQLRLA